MTTATSAPMLRASAPEAPRPEAAPARTARILAWWPVVTLGGGIALWIVSLMRLDPDAIGEYGLLSALPGTMFAAIAVATLGVVIALQRGARLSIVLAHAILFVLIVHATPAIVYGTLRYAWAWKHIGIVELLQRTHRLSPQTPVLPIYQSWPGFFAAATALTEASGLKSALSFASWSPPVFQVLNVAAIVFVFRSLTDDRRRIALTVWLFVIANWVGQDYFAPQALAFFLYMVVIGIVLRWFRRPETQRPWGRPRPMPLEAATDTKRKLLVPGAERRAAALVLLVLMLAVASTHPLTPIVLSVALFLLLFARVLTVRWPVFVMAAMAAGWMCTGARAYVFDQGSAITSQFGKLGSNVDSNISDVGRLSDPQQLVADMGRMVVVAIAVLAVIGFLRRVAAGHWDVEATLLCVAPAAILVGGSYGGEAIFRVFLFTLPFAAFLAAGAFYASPDAVARWRTSVSLVVVSALLMAGFGFGYFGKEAWFRFTPSEVRAAELVFTNAPANSLLVMGTQTFPQQFDNQENFTYVAVADEPAPSQTSVLRDPVTTLYSWMSNPQYAEAYLIFTRAQAAESDETGLMPRGSLPRIQAALLASDRFDVLYRDRDAVVLTVPRTALSEPSASS